MKLMRAVCAILVSLCSAGAERAAAQTTCPRTGSLEQELSLGGASAPLRNIQDVMVHADGRVLITETDAKTLKLFDASGKFVRSIGREGEGPGEFRAISSARLIGDSVWVFDAMLRRGTYLRLDGNAGTVVEFRAPLPNGQLYGSAVPFANRFLVLPGLPRITTVVPAEIVRQLYIVDPSSGRVSTLAPPLLMRAFMTMINLEGRGRVSLPLPTPTIDRLGVSRRDATVTIARGEVTSSGARSVRIARIGSNGDTLFARRVSVPPAPVEPAFIEAELAKTVPIYRPFFPSEEAARRAILDLWVVEKHHPPVSGFMVDGGQRMWLRTSPATNDWLVLDENAAPFACVPAPAELRIVGVTSEHLWGVQSNADGTQALLRYRLVLR